MATNAKRGAGTRKYEMGNKDYPGLIFKWTDAIEARLLELASGPATKHELADIINAEFPQAVQTTGNAVIGKLWRLRRAAIRRAQKDTVYDTFDGKYHELT